MDKARSAEGHAARERSSGVKGAPRSRAPAAAAGLVNYALDCTAGAGTKPLHDLVANIERKQDSPSAADRGR